ncbi:hypothetical protein M513_04209 [Trichuris suis]|uniref:Uncharacterized protein n=1 Tax=Trichuris suis TaxID=68888 RepID=A0A085MCT1_9BILA|nr:hypothetical protein M513_04209 [Trichuris suis]
MDQYIRYAVTTSDGVKRTTALLLVTFRTTGLHMAVPETAYSPLLMVVSQCCPPAIATTNSSSTPYGQVNDTKPKCNNFMRNENK